MTPFWRSRHVFVTGHTGFKGSWLSLVLARAGAEIVGYSDGVPTHPSLYEDARVDALLTSVEGDVRDGRHLAREIERHRPDIVFHLAAQALVRRSYAEPVATYETNLIGTVNVLEAVRDADVEAVVVVTSDKVYAPQPGRRHTEDDPLGGTDPYSSSKAAAELATAAYRSAFFGSGAGPAVATARAGNVIGGGDWAEDRLVPDIARALTAGRPLEIRYPNAVRPWQHVLDPVEGYLLLAERLCTDRATARSWNFGPDRAGCQTVELVAWDVAAAWGAELELVPSAAAPRPEAPSLELDATRARIELGWEPRWDLERAVRETADWYRRQAAGEDARDLTFAQIDAYLHDAPRPPVVT